MSKTSLFALSQMAISIGFFLFWLIVFLKTR